jgi:hypothetical protein
MARISHCDFKEGGCDDGRCKIGSCVAEIEERAKLAATGSRAEMAAALAKGRRLGAVGVTQEQIDAALNDPEQSALVRELFRIRRKISEITERLEFRKRLTGDDH